MERKRNPARAQAALLGMTALFLCLLLGLHLRDRASFTGPETVETEVFLPQESLQPDLTPLDLNAASLEQLQELPGIGPVLAERILAFRAEHGPFETAEDLLEVPGIGPAKLEELKGLITAEHKETT